MRRWWEAGIISRKEFIKQRHGGDPSGCRGGGWLLGWGDMGVGVLINGVQIKLAVPRL